MKFIYDKDGDIFYAYCGNPTTSIYEPIGAGIYLRYDDKLNTVIGLMILNYISRIKNEI
jgi:hypothetical protein